MIAAVFILLLGASLLAAQAKFAIDITTVFTALHNQSADFGVTCDSVASVVGLKLLIDNMTLREEQPVGLNLINMQGNTWRFVTTAISNIQDLKFHCIALAPVNDTQHILSESKVTSLRGRVPELGTDIRLNGSSAVCTASVAHSENLAAFNRTFIQLSLEKNGEPLQGASVGHCGQSCREVQWTVQLDNTATYRCTAAYSSEGVQLQAESSITHTATNPTEPSTPTSSPSPSSLAASFAAHANTIIIMSLCTTISS